MINLFTYGSLMFEAVWSRVVSATCEKQQARLTGYSRREVAGETYPALVPGSRHDRVDGMVYFDLREKDMAALDRFEGDQYYRTREVCLLSDGRSMTAWVFIFKPEYGHRVKTSVWHPEQFAESGIVSFLSEYRGFG
ncbi:MAG: gamma-glutamylcyclotransferase family protein [bacterium]|nr:gamma-glutamylcyclotransferase family protein [bacterium]